MALRLATSLLHSLQGSLYPGEQQHGQQLEGSGRRDGPRRAIWISDVHIDPYYGTNMVRACACVVDHAGSTIARALSTHSQSIFPHSSRRPVCIIAYLHFCH